MNLALAADTPITDAAGTPRPEGGADSADLTTERIAPGERGIRLLAAAGVALVCGLLLWHAWMRTTIPHEHPWLSIYSVMMCLYVVSRFVLAAFYRPPSAVVGYELPRVAVIVPAYNEGEAVAATIEACLNLDYPAGLLEVVVLNDGSQDDTWAQMQAAAQRYDSDTLRLIDLGSNQGKRAAMAHGIRETTAPIVLFVDSDSVPARNALTLLVQGFADERVGSITGITHVRNAQANALTKMQATRYVLSFELIKSAESVTGAVTCAPGCFAAYRREALEPLLEAWENQRFLGVSCTYGDDRALTNRVLRSGWRTLYDTRAQAWTTAPSTYRTFFAQQLRWKKSWLRETPILLAHIWRTRPLALPAVAVATIAGVTSPMVLAASLVVAPAWLGSLPVLYLIGLGLVALAYTLFHRATSGSHLWPWAIAGTLFYVAFSLQIVWALLRLRDGSWGTRRVS